MFRILLLQGANLTYLGKREPEIYGTTTAEELNATLQEHAQRHGYHLEIFYTNFEGEAIERIYQAADAGFDGLVMNPAGFTHAGHALRECVLALPFPYVEVHMTNIAKRGLVSAVAPAAVGTIAGFGLHSYVLGLDAVLRLLDAGR